MIHSGENVVDGVPVDVTRKRIRRINIRVKENGRVALSVPKWWATLREGEEFLRSNWGWILKVRAQLLANPTPARPTVTAEELSALTAVIDELSRLWAGRLQEDCVTWRLRRMKTLWGSCHFRRRHIVYNTELARVSRELVEYVVVHELTHLQAHDHGPRFHALMDERLPGWQALRRQLNRDFYCMGGHVVV